MNEENFIAGIYNYCDRWCERCNYTDRCRLFRTDAERDIQHIINDEDPHDPKVFAKDIEDSLNEAMRMLMEKLKEMNIDTEDIESEDLLPEPDFESYPINKLAEQFTKSMDLLDKLYDFYGEKINEELLKESLTLESREINENLSVLGWYSPQVIAKTKRLIRAHEEYLAQEDEEMKEIDEEELFVTGKLLYIALTNSLSALNNLHELCPEFNSEILVHISLLTRLKEELLKMYPEIPKYKRPYFD